MTTEKNKAYGPVFRFIDYKVYQDSKQWFQEILSLKGILESQTELWQLLKSNITSVMMNIAASSTKLPNEAKRYLGFAITSVNKAVACLDIAYDAQAISSEEFNTLTEGYKQIVIQLKGFIKAIGSRASEKNTEKEEVAEKAATAA